MAYALKPNCIAHGKTRHNRLIKPIYFDIIKGEEVVEDDAIEEDEVPEEIDFSTRKVRVASSPAEKSSGRSGQAGPAQQPQCHDFPDLGKGAGLVLMSRQRATPRRSKARDRSEIGKSERLRNMLGESTSISPGPRSARWKCWKRKLGSLSWHNIYLALAAKLARGNSLRE